ncbi:MAG TPA: transketolase [Ignavibacteria bacterium]|nr:transketolase [Bacteroidota bacterium]HRI85877.1 transketolase [Ignavibacteria bacterium]HRJ98151.1 transketolase [Ignavibacteria bacterium]
MSTNPLLNTPEELDEMSRQIRRDIINMLAISQTGHSGGPLGMADIFTAMYFNKLNIDNTDLDKEDRDYFFLSIGHIAPVWYATLARRGFMEIDELKTLRKINGRLQGHPASPKGHGAPGVEIASGSLGQGLSIAVGMAIGLRMDGRKNHVYCINGDGELQEGQIWEAVMTAAHHNVDNLTMIVDRNHCQIDNRTENVLKLEPLPDKFIAFGWNVLEMDGHNMQDILDTIEKAKAFKGKPTVIIAETFMGKGVSFMEDNYKWHGVPPSVEQALVALSELAPTKYGDFHEIKEKAEA